MRHKEWTANKAMQQSWEQLQNEAADKAKSAMAAVEEKYAEEIAALQQQQSVELAALQQLLKERLLCSVSQTLNARVGPGLSALPRC